MADPFESLTNLLDAGLPHARTLIKIVGTLEGLPGHPQLDEVAQARAAAKIDEFCKAYDSATFALRDLRSKIVKANTRK